MQGGVWQLAGEAARDGDWRVTVQGAVPQVHWRADLAEREWPRMPGQGDFLDRGARALPERVSDGFDFCAQGGLVGIGRGGHFAAQDTLAFRRACERPPHRRDLDCVEHRRVPGEPAPDSGSRFLAGSLGWSHRPACRDKRGDAHPIRELMRGGQRERAAAGLTRQREPVKAELTCQRGQVITPADQAAFSVVIGAAVAGLVR